MLRDHLAANMNRAHEWVDYSVSYGNPCILEKARLIGAYEQYRSPLADLLGAEYKVISYVSSWLTPKLPPELSCPGYERVKLPILKTYEGRLEALRRLDRKIAELEEFEAASVAVVPPECSEAAMSVARMEVPLCPR